MVKQIDQQPLLIHQTLINSGLLQSSINNETLSQDTLTVQQLMPQETMPSRDLATWPMTLSTDTTRAMDFRTFEDLLVRRNGPLRRLVLESVSSAESSHLESSLAPFKSMSIDSSGITIPFPNPKKGVATLDAFLRVLKRTVRKFLVRIILLWPMVRQVLQVYRRIPTMPTMLLTNNIVFEDALGRTMSLPFEHFRHYSVFVERLKCEFNGLPGQHDIERNNFALFDATTPSRRIMAQNWDRVVRPRTKVAMAIVVGSSFYDEQSCPRCKTVAKYAWNSANTKW
jgi:hypothetical protein